MKKLEKIMLVCSVLTTMLGGCISQKVSRIDTDQVTDLSGRWNDTDSRLVAESMTEELTAGSWLQQFIQENITSGSPSAHRAAAKPVVIVGTVFNKTHEHIEADTFIKDIERKLLKEGNVRIVANRVLRKKLREEKQEQAGLTSLEPQKSCGKELGANYMLFGTIAAIVDTERKNTSWFSGSSDKVIFYQVSLELVDLETNEKVWMGDRKLKKYVKRSSLFGSLPN